MSATATYTARPVLQPSVPEFLRRIHRWCTWDTVKGTKKPDQSTRQLADCRAWPRVERSPRRGFVMTGGVQPPGGGYLVALDLDGCRDPEAETLSGWAQEIVEHYGGYAEVTPSGTGLRVWILVDELPPIDSRTKVAIPAPPAPNCTKKPELQLFGAGGAGYVTVTGWKLRELPDEPAAVETLDWLVRRFGLAGGPGATVADQLPVGDGPAPTVAAVRAQLEATARGRSLLDARWHDVCPSRSASEAYYLLVLEALRAAGGHGAVVVELLLDTPWGRGRVDDSREPERYARRAWVEREVARVSGKDRAPFTPLPAPTPPLPNTSPAPGARPTRLLTWDQFQERRAPEQFLLYGLLPRVGVVQVLGAPGSGKTPFALGLAMRVAAGAAGWWARDLERHGHVVYVVGEDANGLAWRAHAEVLAGASRAEEQWSPTEIVRRFHWTACPARLIDPVDAAAWAEDIAATVGDEDCALVVIDTQVANFGGDENETRDMAQLFVNLSTIAQRLRCLIMLVHHVGLSAPDRARGSSVQPGAVDCALLVEREEGLDVRITSRKEKNWAKPDPLRGTLVPVEVGTDAKGRPITAVTLSDRQAHDREAAELHAAHGLAVPALRLLRAVLEAGAVRAGAEDWAAPELTRAQLGTLAGVTSREVPRLLDALEAAGYLRGANARRGRGHLLIVSPKGAAAAGWPDTSTTALGQAPTTAPAPDAPAG